MGRKQRDNLQKVYKDKDKPGNDQPSMAVVLVLLELVELELVVLALVVVLVALVLASLVELKSVTDPTPGLEKSENGGQSPTFAGSPPMRTHWEYEGVGPSSTKSWNQPGGAMRLFGGAVIVHVLPAHENSGNRVRWPKLLPCVLTTAMHKQ